MHANQITRHTASYDDWMKAVNRYLFARLGISIHDLADFRSRDLYQDGASAEEAALTALECDDVGALMLDLFDDLYD
jgi:DNA-binding ferritin-like protein (Dps family)